MRKCIKLLTSMTFHCNLRELVIYDSYSNFEVYYISTNIKYTTSTSKRSLNVDKCLLNALNTFEHFNKIYTKINCILTAVL